ncbi:phage head morphogenesis protein [Yersinia sp. 2545 StPb PI]|uniref:phage head morphogenesis protein n=1 Tax=Yersinia sp. 2545 StPb PI TaxID=3117410 RepID=UPI003FA4B437
MNESVGYWLKSGYKTALAEVEEDRQKSTQQVIAIDASPVKLLQSAIKKLSRRWQKRFDDMADKLAGRFADRSLRNSDVSLSSALSDIGVTVKFTMTNEMNNALQSVIGENVNLIKSIPEQYLTQVETMVMQSVGRGRDLGHLAEELQKRYGITKRRAATIARDQNNKATATMQSARQQALGITEGIWHHSHAGKTQRASHVKADGKRFELSKGMYLDGEWQLPGEAINCRCTWSAIIPGLDS